MAASTVDCHCFQERSYASEQPAAMDPYLLATVQNRLMAHAFGVPRKTLVSMKMAGASADDLWVTYWVADVSGRSFEDVQTLMAAEGSWPRLVASRAADPEALGSHFMAALADDREASLAWAVVTHILEHSFGAPEEQTRSLRDAGASLKEAVLATLLGTIRNADPRELFREARRDGSWGRLTIDRGTSIDMIESFIASRLNHSAK